MVIASQVTPVQIAAKHATMDEEEGDHLRIDDIVVIMMILVPLRGRNRRTHSKLVMA